MQRFEKIHIQYDSAQNLIHLRISFKILKKIDFAEIWQEWWDLTGMTDISFDAKIPISNPIRIFSEFHRNI